MPLQPYEKFTIGERNFKIYERTSTSGSKQWEVWESIDGRGVRKFGPASRKKCYEFVREVEGRRTYASPQHPAARGGE